MSLIDRVRQDPRYMTAGFLTTIVIVGQVWLGFVESLPQFGTAIAFSMATELVLGRIYRGQWVEPISAYMTGVSTGILVRSPDFWPYAVGTMLAIGQKYAVQIQGRHLFNPSNFAVSVLLLAAPNSVAGLTKQWTNAPWVMGLVFLLGLMVVARLRRLDVSLTYLSAFSLLAWHRSTILDVPLYSELGQVVGPVFQLFIFFMITDPKTSPATRNGRIVYALTVALADHAFRLMRNQNATFFALTVTTPLVVLIETYLASRKKQGAALVGAPAR